MNEKQVCFGDWIQKGFDLYAKNLGILLPAGLIAGLLAFVTGGILAGPMMAGLALIVLRLLRGAEPKPLVGDVFKGFDVFLQSFLFFLVWGVISFVAVSVFFFLPVINSLAVFVIQTFVVFGLFLIIDRKMDFWPASMESAKTIKPVFFPMFGFVIVSSLLGGLGAILCGIGVLLTMPLMVCFQAVAYEAMVSGEPAAEVPADTNVTMDVSPEPPAPPDRGQG